MRILLAWMWCLHFLPLPLLGRFGEVMGSLFYWILPERRHITLTNLRLCFPELTQQERNTLAKQHFQAYARSILERSILWWSSEGRLKRLIQIESAIPLHVVNTEPAIFLCPHFVSLEVAGALGLQRPICSIYSPQKNKLFDAALKKGRLRFGDRLFSRSAGIKPIIRALREGVGFLMLPDMDFGIKDAEFVPFFGVQAATLTAPARLAAATNVRVIPVTVTLLPHYQGWCLKIHAPWENFPGKDMVAATQTMNSFIEEQIRLTPAEYLWSHRRFKTRPKGEADFYS